MEFMQFKDRLFYRAAEEGFSEYELYYTRNDNFSVNVYKGEIDKYSVSDTMGVGFRGIVNGKMGYSSTTKMDDFAVDMLVASAKESALSIDSDDRQFILNSLEKYESVNCYNENMKKIPVQDRIQLALDIERETRRISDKVINISYCVVGFYQQEIGLINSFGVELSLINNFIFAAVNPVVTDGKNNYNSFSFVSTRNFSDIDPLGLARKAVKEAEAYIGGESLKSGVYRTILRNDVAAELLNTFDGAFSAENVQKGLSLLKGKLNSKIASEVVSIIDDPLLPEGLASAPFDGEGFPCYKKSIIEKGYLQTYIHNMKTAAKDGIKSTGNASRPSYASPIGISPANLYVAPGELTLEEMILKLEEGLLITNIAGTHAGANMVTGDFSLAAKGFLIKKGKIVKPVEQITIAGNFFQLIMDIEEVCSDLEFKMPSGSSSVGSPSVLVKKISIAGC